MALLKEFSVAAIAVVCFVVIIALSITALPAIYGYRILAGRVEVVVFGVIPIFSFDGQNIIEVKRQSSWSTFFYSPFRTLRVGNRLSGESIILVRRGFIKYVIFTPRNVNEFYASLRALTTPSAGC